MSDHIIIIIPVLNPNASFLATLNLVSELGFRIVVVNDGSRCEFKEIFAAASEIPRVTVLHHAENLGKGRALKSAFNHCLLNFPNAVGFVTADSDGQHSPQDINAVAETLVRNPDRIVMGCREFRKQKVPWKSKFGNLLTVKTFFWASGLKISDTQTGLRGIPSGFARKLMNCPGERFEYETNMLMSAARGRIRFMEVQIRTIYFDNNSETHFDPVSDSLRIYGILYRSIIFQFMKFVLSSATSALIDIAIFAILIRMFPLAVSVISARIVSGAFNYLANKIFVFRSQGKTAYTAARYLMLFLIIMSLSYLLTSGATALFPGINVVLLKAVVDVALFITSYIVQKTKIFNFGG